MSFPFQHPSLDLKKLGSILFLLTGLIKERVKPTLRCFVTCSIFSLFTAWLARHAKDLAEVPNYNPPQ